jgi:hypothetical protein
VVFDHGYGHTAYSWVQHAEQVAKRDGVIAVAIGWRVGEGADGSIAAAKMLDIRCAPNGTRDGGYADGRPRLPRLVA